MKKQFAKLGVAACIAGAVVAQDSVSKTPCLPGDGTRPWTDATDAFGSEQCDDYVLQLAPITSSWSNTYQVGPLAKTSKSQDQFFGSLASGNGMSRLQALGVPFASSSYSEWVGVPGAGVHNDPSLSDPGTAVDTSSALGHQFAAAFSEFGSPGASYNGIVTSVVNFDPTDPTRLFVRRTMAAVNGCSGDGDYAQFGFGSVTEDGEAFFRIDGFGTSGGPCAGLTPTATNNVFKVESLARDCDVRNVISDEAIFGTGDVDAGATSIVIPVYGTTLNAPGVVPGSVTGGKPMYIGTDFGANFVSGEDAFSGFSATTAHLAPGAVDHRGNISWSPHNFDFLGSTHGTCAVIGMDGTFSPTIVNLFGISIAGGAVTITGKHALSLPASVTDPITGFTPANAPLMTHYHSQAAYRGGNGQIALQKDPLTGELLVATTVSNDGTSAGSNDFLSVVVGRVDPTTGADSWMIAGYNNTGGPGKSLLDGPGGAAIGELDSLFTGVPNIGVPMLSATGDVFFIASVEEFNPADTGVGLVRAVFNGTGYELELVFDSGRVVSGANSGRDYSISLIELADSNSLSSASAYSQNIQSNAHLGQDPSSLAPGSVEGLGGLVIAVEITYDFEPDGDFDACSATTPVDPLTEDQDYNVLLYVGAGTPGSDLDGNGRADESEMLQGDNTAISLAAGGSVNFDLRAGIEHAGRGYWFLGSVSGTGPGPFGFGIPLTYDGYFQLRINHPTIFFATGTGFLDGTGQATDTFTYALGADPTLAGLQAHHAYAIYDLALPGFFAGASNPWPTALNP